MQIDVIKEVTKRKLRNEAEMEALMTEIRSECERRDEYVPEKVREKNPITRQVWVEWALYLSEENTWQDWVTFHLGLAAERFR